MVNESERKYHPVSAIFPMMTETEYKTLKADIANKGLLESIWLHPDGSIVDGRNRHSACVETGTPPRFRTWNGKGSLVDFVVSLNLHRRHLTKSQKAAAALEALPLLEKENEERRREKISHFRQTGETAEKIPSSKESREQAASLFDTNSHYVSDAKKIQEQEPEIFKEVKSGKITIPQAKKQAAKKRKEKKQESGRATLPPELKARFSLFCGDFVKVCQQIEPHSIDVVITDPPYPKEFLPLYGELSKAAKRILKPGGSLLAMAGQSYLPDVINLLGQHLTYHWAVSYLTPGGQSPQIWQRKVNTFWKPVLWYVNEDYNGDWVGDVVKSDVNDKRFHHWGQSESGIARLVERFSIPGDLICDPMCGGGTTGIVSLLLDRRFIGIDIEQKNIDITLERMGEMTNGKTS